jgi:hypothetical protein
LDSDLQERIIDDLDRDMDSTSNRLDLVQVSISIVALQQKVHRIEEIQMFLIFHVYRRL